ncbi:TLC domain-containing protein 2 isoform X2 [Procambarus clarkii]|uniref:TLC domain-containing protein 2 isoform X2 n=1 Tax=Procambarus clarkii TaxID=6728 RepID=UPI003742598E
MVPESRERQAGIKVLHLPNETQLRIFYEHPKLAEDLINTYTSSSHILISFSVGYFIHDFLDMALCHRKRSSYELMVHHACVISCFGLSVWSAMFLGYAVVALFVEVNSIFLHVRQLLIITGVSREEPKYRLNAMLNIATFVVFRIAVLGWMTRWIVLHKDNLSLSVYTLGSVGLAIIMLMNTVLFFRICNVDFRKRNPRLKQGEFMLFPSLSQSHVTKITYNSLLNTISYCNMLISVNNLK